MQLSSRYCLHQDWPFKTHARCSGGRYKLLIINHYYQIGMLISVIPHH